LLSYNNNIITPFKYQYYYSPIVSDLNNAEISIKYLTGFYIKPQDDPTVLSANIIGYNITIYTSDINKQIVPDDLINLLSKK